MPVLRRWSRAWPLKTRSRMRSRINDFAIKLANVNGSGSASANGLLMQAIFRMGIPVSGKNLFPSNIQGLPTWYEIRVNKYGHTKALRDSNHKAIRLGFDYIRDNYSFPLPFHLEKMDGNTGKILVDGNTATALGCLYAGATVAAWYPITPATSVMDSFKIFCEQYRKDKETAVNNYIILQPEDELGAIPMLLAASWNAARSFTSTAGPGVSLMNELLGFAYFTEIPAVLIDVQRVGPSTGMPTRTQQADIMECAYASHVDT